MSHAPRRGRTWKLPAHPRRTARLGSYQLLAELGRGGTGVVYRARRVGEEQDVALKVLRRPTPEEAARFRKEAQLVSGLDHPGIVQLVAHGRVREEWFLAFELIEGGSLLDRLCRGPLSPSHAARLIAEVADVIEAAHEAGVVHRDIKPANVLLDAQGAVKVADFGIALIEAGDRRTRTGVAMGSFAFMPPEVIERNVITVHFDDKGIVKEVKKVDLSAGQDINPVERITPTSGNEITFWDQLFSNVGRFSKGATGDRDPAGK